MRERWEENTAWMQASLLAYNQLREYEEAEKDENFQKLLIKLIGGSATK